ncbi:MAG: hypothetical protein ACH350_01590 [Parachlamydiaceae bacterium]
MILLIWLRGLFISLLILFQTLCLYSISKLGSKSIEKALVFQEKRIVQDVGWWKHSLS